MDSVLLYTYRLISASLNGRSPAWIVRALILMGTANIVFRRYGVDRWPVKVLNNVDSQSHPTHRAEEDACRIAQHTAWPTKGLQPSEKESTLWR
jgi:hypothetical protein